MRLQPLYQERIAQIKRESFQEGERLVIENLLRSRFGSLDDELVTVIEPILALSPEECSQLLLQLSSLSREELLRKFG